MVYNDAVVLCFYANKDEREYNIQVLISFASTRLPPSCSWHWLTDKEGFPYVVALLLWNESSPDEWTKMWERYANEKGITELPRSYERYFSTNDFLLKMGEFSD